MCEIPSGTFTAILAGIILCCEYAPSGIEAYAMLSPLLNSVIFEPTSSILPAASKPIPIGNVRGYNPDL